MRGFFIAPQKNIFYRGLSGFLVCVLSLSLIFSPTASYAQSINIFNLPVPGAMVPLSPAFAPVLLKGMTIHPDDPLKFDFIIDSGNTDFTTDQIKEESERLVKYFLASMTVPKDDLWVNLSPYESDRIIPEELGKTELGRDMLAQDYILKQLTASLMYPEEELGKKFWDRIYQRAQEEFGTSEIPVNTFNKVWILPESATVYEHEQTVYVVDARLKVMLDSDYMAMEHGNVGAYDNTPGQDGSLEVSESIIREIILPEIEHEVNHGKNFAPLRQIYHSLILAKWYKETVKNSLLSQVYVDQNKIAGVDLEDKTVKDQIYAQYMEAYKKGVFNYIKEDYDALSDEVIPRKYFSGGLRIGAGEIHRTSSLVRDSQTPQYRASVEIAPRKIGVSSPISNGPWTVWGARKVLDDPMQTLAYHLDYYIGAINKVGENNNKTGKDIERLKGLLGFKNERIRHAAESYLTRKQKVDGYMAVLQESRYYFSIVALYKLGEINPIIVKVCLEVLRSYEVHPDTRLENIDALEWIKIVKKSIIAGNREAFDELKSIYDAQPSRKTVTIHDPGTVVDEYEFLDSATGAPSGVFIPVMEGGGSKIVEGRNTYKDYLGKVIDEIEEQISSSPVKKSDYRSGSPVVSLKGLKRSSFDDSARKYAKYNAAIKKAPKFEDFDSFLLWYIGQMAQTLPSRKKGGEKISAGYAVQALSHAGKIKGSVEAFQRSAGAYEYGRDNETIWKAPKFEDFDSFILWYTGQTKWTLPSGNEDGEMIGASYAVLVLDHAEKIEGSVKAFKMDATAYEYVRGYDAIRRAPKFKSFSRFIQWHIRQTPRTLPSGNEDGEKLGASYAVQILGHAGKIKEGSVEAFQRNAGAYERAVKEKEVISREIQRIWSQDIGAGLYQTDLKRLFARFDPEMLLNLNVKKAKRILSERYRRMILEYAYEGYGKYLIARLEAQSSSPVSLPVLFADWPGKEGQTETVESIDQHLRLIREAVPDAQLRILSQFTGVGEQGPSALQEIIEQERPAIILVRSKTEAFKEEAGVEFLKMAKRNGVKAIIRMGAGYDNINEVAAADEGISVIRTHGNANSVAELSLFQLAALARMEGKELSSDAPGTNTRWEDLFKTSPEAYLELIKESKKWPDGTAKDEIIRRTAHLQQFIFDAISGKEVAYVAEALRGRTIGLLGFGPIAQEFAAKLQMIKDITGVKFTVLATSRSLTPGDPRLEGLDVVVVTREELFSASDIVSVHIPVKGALKITRKELLENPNIIGVINTARSGLLDTGLMREFLVAGGFYLGDFDLKPDTFKLFKDHLARAMLLPHIGAGTKDAKEGVKANTKGALASLLEIYLGQKTFSETSNIDLVNNVVPEQIEIPGSPTHASSPVVTGLADSSVDDEMYQTGIIGMPGEILQFDHIEGGILLMAEHSGGKSSLSIMLMERDPTLKAVAAGASEVQWIDSSGGKILSGRRRTESPIIYSRILGSRSVPMTENKSARVRWIVSLDGTSEDFLRKARKQGIEVIDVSDLNVFTQFEEISRRINNAVRSSSPVTEDGDVGGIDLNAIEVQRQGAASVDIQFDPVEVQQIIDMGIDGFAPVIINITPLPSVLPLLGLAPQRDEEEFELSRN